MIAVRDAHFYLMIRPTIRAEHFNQLISWISPPYILSRLLFTPGRPRFSGQTGRIWIYYHLLRLGVDPGDCSFTKTTRFIKNDPIVPKKCSMWMRILKILDWLLKERTQNKWKLVKENVKIRNAFLLSRTCSQLGTHFRSVMCSKSSRNKGILFCSNQYGVIL